MSRRGPAALALALALLAAAPATAPARPKTRGISYRFDGLRQVLRPVARALDPARGVRALSGRVREAANVDDRDQVRLPSTWWTPRVGYRPVAPEDMVRATGGDRGPIGRWTIVKAKSQGVSPGFQIVDGAGVRWAIKLDPVEYPELTTGADVVTSKLFWAAGYNVPENVIATFGRADLAIKPGLRFHDPLVGERPFTAAHLDSLLARGARLPDGRWRCVASRFLPGEPLGEFAFEGRRRDDPEDLVPHQLRRELRGLWAISAWLNDDDRSARNTLDCWVTERGRSFVRHYLLDFSTTLGAASFTRQPYRTGHEYVLDFGVGARNLVTLGLVHERWEEPHDPRIPGVGFVDAATFDPAGWRTLIPNPAFDARTARDVHWGVRIVAAFDEDLIRTAVRQGAFSDPRAEDYLVRTLIARRDRLVRRWLPEATAALPDSTSPGRDPDPPR